MAMTIILIVHILAAIAIIGLVLLQHGKGADAGAAFGAGAAGGVSGSVFGAQGSSNFLSRTTAILATVFFVTSLSLAYLSHNSKAEPKSIMEKTTVTEKPKTAPEKVPVPAAPNDVPKLPQDTPQAPVSEQTQPGVGATVPAQAPEKGTKPTDVPKEVPSPPDKK
jgi:preprotein translocase subunit SecG